jgi:RNA recognition motif-containing protein
MTSIYVGNLGTPITETDLRTEFERYGRVHRVYVCSNFALVGMEDKSAAKRAITDLNGRTTWFLREYPS